MTNNLTALEKVAFARMLGKGIQGAGRMMGRGAPAGGKMTAQMPMAGSGAHAAAARSQFGNLHPTVAPLQTPTRAAAPAAGAMGRGVAGMPGRGAPLLGRVGGLLTPRNLIAGGAAGAAAGGMYAANRLGNTMRQQKQQQNSQMDEILNMNAAPR